MTSRPIWLEGYGGQSVDELVALAASHRVDSIVLAFEEALQRKQYLLGRKALSLEELTVLATEALEREVNNGGYRQFFSNSSVEYVADIVGALERIGKGDVAQMTRRAIEALGLGCELTPEGAAVAIKAPDETRDQTLADLSDTYFKVAGDLADPLFTYVRENRDRIRL